MTFVLAWRRVEAAHLKHFSNDRQQLSCGLFAGKPLLPTAVELDNESSVGSRFHWTYPRTSMFLQSFGLRAAS